MLSRHAAQLAAPCAAADFHAFLAPRGAAALENVATRVVSWGLYADQLAAVRAAGFPDENLLVILSETALRDSATTLAFVVDWLGLDAFDFSALATYRDALGVERLRDPGLLGAARAFYAQHNTLMVRRHTAEPIDPKKRKLLDAYYKRHNHALAVLLLKTAPAVAVYPPRVVGTPFLPENWS